MNLLVSRNLDDVTSDRLPPAKRQGPARILFINTMALGFSTQARQLQLYSARRGDIEAVHVNLAYPLWVKIIGKSLPVGGWDFHTFRYLQIYRRILRRWLRGPLDISRFDVVHWMTQAIALAMVDLKHNERAAARERRPAHVLHVDGTAALETRTFAKSRIAQAPFAHAEQRMFDAADLIACMSKWSANSVAGDYGIGQDRIMVAPGCVGLNPAVPARTMDGAAQRAPGSLVRMIFVSSSWKLKRGPELVRMHQQRFADRAELHIVSGGAVPDRSARNVIWHGAVPRETLLGRLLPTMDLFVSPTRQDMSPWAILEAAAAALPVVSSRLAGIPEIVIDGETGILVDRDDLTGFGDAVDRLLSEAHLRLKMGRAAAEHVRRNFDPDVTYNRLMDRLVRLADEAEGANEADEPVSHKI